MDLHLEIHAIDKPYTCTTCERKFATEGKLSRHKKSHTNQKTYDCMQRIERFARRKRRKRMHGRKPYLCSECNKECSSKQNLDYHMKIHTGENLFNCAKCNKQFRTTQGLIHHLHVFHAGAKPFSCSVCRKRFQDKSGLNRHFKIHTGERHFTCQICNKSFLQKQTLICHSKTHSKPCRKSTVKSNNIQINDESEKSLISDQTSGDRIQFDADGKSFISLECHKLPRLEQTLSDQAEMELGRTRLENCKNSRTGQTLDNRSSIESIDGADKPFQCTKCDKRFTLKRYILRHMRTHTNLRPYACAVCKKEFSIKMYLASHMKIHTGEKPFPCTGCEKKFKTRQGLGYHMKSHTESNMNCS